MRTDIRNNRSLSAPVVFYSAMYLLVIAITLGIFLWFRSRTRLDFPGPTQWPLLGNLPQLDGDTVHKILQRWAKQHGSVYKINLFGDEVGPHVYKVQ